MIADLSSAWEAMVGLRADQRLPGRIHLSLEGPVATITVDNPSARNALTVGMMEDLLGAVQTLQRWGGAVVVVRSGAPGIFCAGGHLGQVRKSLGTTEAGRAMASVMGPVLDALYGLPAVSVAVLEGPAVGGGAELATACDHRLWTTAAWAQFRQAELGVAAGWGGTRRLLTQVSSSTALRWLTTAVRLDASTAQTHGFADVVCAPDGVEAALQAFLRPVLDLPVAGVRAVKTQVAAARPLLSDRATDIDAFAAVWGADAHRAAMDRSGR